MVDEEPRRARQASPRGSASPRARSPSPPPPPSPPPLYSPLGTGTRPPTDCCFVFFQNARVAAAAPYGHQLKDAHKLPDDIRFYVHVASQDVPWPPPPQYATRQYLHTATIASNHEAAGPVARIRFSPRTVIGLLPQHLVGGACSVALVIRVPSTRTVNTTLSEAKIRFQPTHADELHSTGLSSGTAHMPRLIVPVSSHGAVASRLTDRVKRRMVKAILCPWEGSPRADRLETALKRWWRVVRWISDEEKQRAEARRRHMINFADAAVGSPLTGPFEKHIRESLSVPGFREQGVSAIFFQNAKVAIVAPRPKELPTRHLLPPVITFYIKVKTADVDFPLPEARYPSKKYLHTAGLVPGSEYAGPVSHLALGIDNVVGLQRHHMRAPVAGETVPMVLPSTQLTIVVPSTGSVNIGVHPTCLSFSPSSNTQLRARSKAPARVIVPLHPRSSPNEHRRVSEGLTTGDKFRRLQRLFGVWDQLRQSDKKLAGLRRWSLVAKSIPLPAYKNLPRPPPQPIGSPYLESLPPSEVHPQQHQRWTRVDLANKLHCPDSNTQRSPFEEVRFHDEAKSVRIIGDIQPKAAPPPPALAGAYARGETMLFDKSHAEMTTPPRRLSDSSLRLALAIDPDNPRTPQLASPARSLSPRGSSPRGMSPRWLALSHARATDSPRAMSPRSDSPRQHTPRSDSARQLTPRSDSSRRRMSPRAESPRAESPRGPPTRAWSTPPVSETDSKDSTILPAATQHSAFVSPPASFEPTPRVPIGQPAGRVNFAATKEKAQDLLALLGPETPAASHRRSPRPSPRPSQRSSHESDAAGDAFGVASSSDNAPGGLMAAANAVFAAGPSEAVRDLNLQIEDLQREIKEAGAREDLGEVIELQKALPQLRSVLQQQLATEIAQVTKAESPPSSPVFVNETKPELPPPSPERVAPGGAMDAHSIVDLIGKLKQLADSGAITQDSFEQKSNELLARI